MRPLSTLALLLGASLLTCGQPGAGSPAFEVASVKPAGQQTGDSLVTSTRTDPGGIRYDNVSLRIIIQQAYNVKPYQVIGPSWIEDDRYLYNVVAKAPAGTPKEMFPAMLQTLLAERFKLAIHRETREETGYELVAGKRPLLLKKSKEAAPGARGGVSLMPVPGGVRVDARRTTMTSFAQTLSVNLGRPVSDMTGIQGNFDIVLEFSGEDLPGRFRFLIANAQQPAAQKASSESGPAPDAGRLPSLFAAVEQLGLKLDPRKVPVERIVVDKAEKVPISN